MRFKYTFEFVNLGDETILVPVGDNANQVQGVIKANDTGDKIIQLLMQEKNEDEVIDILSKECENNKESLKEYVHSVVDVLVKNEIVE